MPQVPDYVNVRSGGLLDLLSPITMAVTSVRNGPPTPCTWLLITRETCRRGGHLTGTCATSPLKHQPQALQTWPSQPLSRLDLDRFDLHLGLLSSLRFYREISFPVTLVGKFRLITGNSREYHFPVPEWPELARKVLCVAHNEARAVNDITLHRSPVRMSSSPMGLQETS